MNTLLRVVLVDDHAVMRSGLRLLIEAEPDIHVVGEAATAAEGVEQVVALRPDVTVMDITLPDCDGVECTRRIRAAWPQARILALTMHGEDVYLVPFLEAGGAGYVRKSAADREVVAAIRRVANGETYLQSAGVQTIVDEHRAKSAVDQPLPDVLSQRERQVLELTARGFTSREIGEQLSLSPRTIDTYRERIMEKLKLEHRSQLVEYAVQHHLLG
jgi:DNA-binding NarL/FixJ family response regulator